MDLKIANDDLDITEEDLTLVSHPEVDILINHWKTLKGSEVIHYFTDNGLDSLDSQYGSYLHLYKSNPITTEWINNVNRELTEAPDILNSVLILTDVSLAVENYRTVDIKIKYRYPEKTEQLINFNLNSI